MHSYCFPLAICIFSILSRRLRVHKALLPASTLLVLCQDHGRFAHPSTMSRAFQAFHTTQQGPSHQNVSEWKAWKVQVVVSTHLKKRWVKLDHFPRLGAKIKIVETATLVSGLIWSYQPICNPEMASKLFYCFLLFATFLGVSCGRVLSLQFTFIDLYILKFFFESFRRNKILVNVHVIWASSNPLI